MQKRSVVLNMYIFIYFQMSKLYKKTFPNIRLVNTKAGLLASGSTFTHA